MDVLIIGSGVAGCSAASAVKEKYTGFNVTVITEETDPLYSPCVLPYYLSGKLEREQTFIREGENLESLGVTVLSGEKVEKVDLKERIVYCSRALHYDRLILAVGAEAVRPRLPGSTLPGNYVLKTLADTEQLRSAHIRKAVVVGSGPIGVETALAVRELKQEVLLIEKQDRVLPAMLGISAGDRACQILEAAGIEVWCEAEVTEVIGHTRVEGIRAGDCEAFCDTVIWNVGMRPATSFLQDSNLPLSHEGFVVTNKFLETAFPGVYACGDCVAAFDLVSSNYRPLMLWHRAKEEGRTAGLNVGGAEIVVPVPVQRVVVNIGETSFAALGHLPDQYDYALEYSIGNRYYCLIYCRDRLVHMHSINDPCGPGLFSYLLGKKGKKITKRELLYQVPVLR